MSLDQNRIQRFNTSVSSSWLERQTNAVESTLTYSTKVSDYALMMASSAFPQGPILSAHKHVWKIIWSGFKFLLIVKLGIAGYVCQGGLIYGYRHVFSGHYVVSILVNTTRYY